ncbi:monocarboxylate uptake permease MctP [Paenibacillus thalictri]|uniref:Sodium:solute symporter family protein n=1 Tax=Paenibacillus thalictri TaxID=2527873 RepID=A0A4Q9DKC2_9BACL|nr:sodium:solute symporter family protein [Paenibacillus thalictri]TBL75141.1 sodium:solute symporter family protein [Paenibacillus thalictri]
MNWTAFIVFLIFFLLVTVVGFLSANWRKGNLELLDEWGLGGRRFGTLITWFLLGGDLYTAYTFIAVPASMYAKGGLGFFAIPYTILIYPFIFVVFPRLWSVAKKHGYITAADFVRGRYGSSTLALAIAITGILATMPYIALQLVGMQAVLVAMGFSGTGLAGDLPLIVAFLVLAIYTYNSGLRAPAAIAVVKDLMIYVSVAAVVIYIPYKLGGFGPIFDAAEAKHHEAAIITPKMFAAYSTLALGSGLALFLYPHSLTGIFSSKSRDVIKRNAALLPAYSLALGVIALLGYMALAAGIKVTNPNDSIPQLFLHMFPDWFSGFVFAAIAIGALVPAAIMSIAAANLFTRNIYKEYINQNCTDKQEAKMAKMISLIVKLGALVFILLMNKQDAINLQLLGGIWILQTVPAVIVGLYTNWFNKSALLIGWIAGMGWGTYMAASTGYGNQYKLPFGLAEGTTIYSGLYALAVNLIVSLVLTIIFRAVGVKNGKDETNKSDYDFEEATTAS